MQNSEICVYLNTVSGVNCSFGKIVITQRSSVVTEHYLILFKDNETWIMKQVVYTEVLPQIKF